MCSSSYEYISEVQVSAVLLTWVFETEYQVVPGYMLTASSETVVCVPSMA